MNFLRPMKKKGIGGLDNLVLSLVVIGFLLSIGLTLMGKLYATQTAGSYEKNATAKVLQAIDDIPDWMGIIVLAFIAVVVLGVVYMLRRGRG